MCISITKIFLATTILLFRPSLTQAESKQLPSSQYSDKSTELSPDNQSLLTNKDFSQYTLFLTNNKTTLQPSLYNSLPANLVLETQNNILHESQIKKIVEQIIMFKPGVASWQTSSKLGVLEFNGNFNSLAQLIKGKASWKAETILGLVDVLINVDQQISLLNTATAWKANTALGTVAIKGNFDQDISFTGANATWNADTSLGSLAVKGNFTQTSFSGGKVEVVTEALIGSFKADIKIDHQTRFSGVNASWSANLPLGSNVKINGSFDQKKTFTGGSIKFKAKSTLGNLGIKANLDRNQNLASGSAFWEAQAGLGFITLNADLKKDGSYDSELSIHFPL